MLDQHSIEREEKKEWVEIRQRHQIESTLIRVDSYVNELVDVLLQFEISDISENSSFDYGIKATFEDTCELRHEESGTVLPFLRHPDQLYKWSTSSTSFGLLVPVWHRPCDPRI